MHPFSEEKESGHLLLGDVCVDSLHMTVTLYNPPLGLSFFLLFFLIANFLAVN